MSLLITTILLTFCNTNSEVVECNGNCACSQHYLPESEETCTLNCGADMCKSSQLTCAPGRPCHIMCNRDTSCADSTEINAMSSTDVKIICNGNDACKSYINIHCGTGDCTLLCGQGTSCEELDPSLIDVSRSHSFICINCPPTIANLQFTLRPTKSPTVNPTYQTRYPSIPPTKYPTYNPSVSPTKNPTKSPSYNPSKYPTYNPTKYPTLSPSKNPTNDPTIYPSVNPTYIPTNIPTVNPTYYPTYLPTYIPTVHPTNHPTEDPTKYPSSDPTFHPTNNPTTIPTLYPTNNPTYYPTNDPTYYPTQPSISPSDDPTMEPTTHKPSVEPTQQPTHNPTHKPSDKEIIMLTKDINLLYHQSNMDNNSSNSESILVTVLLVSIFIILIVSVVIVWWYRKKAFNIAMRRLQRVDSSVKSFANESDEKQTYFHPMHLKSTDGMIENQQPINYTDGNIGNIGNIENDLNLNQTKIDQECDEGTVYATYALRMHYNGRKFDYKLDGKDVIQTGNCEWDEDTFKEIMNVTKKKFGVNHGEVKLFEVVGDCPIDIDAMDDIVCSFYDTNRKSIDIYVKAENDIHYVDNLELAQR